MKKRFGVGVIGLCLMAMNGLGQDLGALSRAAPAELLPPPAVEDVPAPDIMSMSLDALKAQAAAMLREGDTNAAIGALVVYNARSLRQSVGDFNALLNMLLTADNRMEAESIYQDVMIQRNELDRSYYNRLHQYYVGQSNAPAMLEWAASLPTRGWPPDLRVRAFAWLLEASRAVGPVSRVTELVPVCITNFNASAAGGLLAGVIAAYDGAGDQVSAHKVLDAIERTTRLPDELRLLALCQRAKLLFSAAQWVQAEKRFQKEAKTLPDGALAEYFQCVRACAIRANQLDLLDRLCVWILKEQKKKSGTWQTAADAWLENVNARKSAADIPIRLAALMQMGCPKNNLVGYYYKYWVVTLKAGRPADVRAMIQFGERLAAALTNKQDKEILRLCAFDGYVILEDYERALQMLEEPFPNMTLPVRQIAANKIKAHLALQKGNKPEAVERFRAFMETVKAWARPEVDFVTGLSYTKEMCLGLNARRIGDILSSLNDAQGAQAAYREAEGYYAIAQKEVRANSPESEYIKACQDELAKLKQK